MSRLCPPRRGDLQGALGVFLTPYVREIGPSHRPDAVVGRGFFLDGLEGMTVRRGHATRPRQDLLFAAKVGHRLRQRANGNDLHALHERGLRGIRLRHEHSLEPFLLGDGGHRQDAVGVPKLTVQRQLAEEHRQRRRVGELSRTYQDGQGYGKIVGRPRFSQVGGRQTGRDASNRELAPGVPNGRPDSLTGLLDRRVGQPHDVERRQSRRDVHLDLDDVPVEPDNCASQCLREHVSFP